MARRKTSSNYTSKGERRNVARKWLKSCRLRRSEGDRVDAQWKAYTKGKRVVLTVKNPNKNQTNRQFIKINAKEYWKPSREST